jgi:hypothetical protein
VAACADSTPVEADHSVVGLLDVNLHGGQVALGDQGILDLHPVPGAELQVPVPGTGAGERMPEDMDEEGAVPPVLESRERDRRRLRKGQGGDMKKRQPMEEMVRVEREAEALLAQGKPVEEACRVLGISESTKVRWRHKDGGLSTPEAKRLR